MDGIRLVSAVETLTNPRGYLYENMAALHYLTVQDLLWINLRVTGTVNDYDFMKLEEGTFFQYAYGNSTDLKSQAARFAAGFAKNAPFSAGNDETATLASLAVLHINGLNTDPAKRSGLARALGSEESVRAWIDTAAKEVHGSHSHEGEVPDIHAAVEEILSETSLTPAWSNSE